MNWEDFADLLEQHTSSVLTASDGDAIQRARVEFLRRTGEPFAEETGADRRDQAFYEWYAFDELGTALDGCEQVGYLVGTVKPMGGEVLQVRSWLNNEKYRLIVGTTIGVSRGDAVVARTYKFADACYASTAAEMIPSKLAKEIKRQLQWLANDRTEEREMWERAMRFLLVAQRYGTASPRDVVSRWIALEAQGQVA